MGLNKGSSSSGQQRNGSGNLLSALSYQSSSSIPTAKRHDRVTGQTTWSHRVIFGDPSQFSQGLIFYTVLPGYRVPDGCSVRLRAANGANAGNTKAVYVGASISQIIAGHGTVLQPGDDVAWPVDNLATVWVAGSNTDGIVVSVIANTASFS